MYIYIECWLALLKVALAINFSLCFLKILNYFSTHDEFFLHFQYIFQPYVMLRTDWIYLDKLSKSKFTGNNSLMHVYI